MGIAANESDGELVEAGAPTAPVPTSPSASVLDMRQITKSYGTMIALDNVDFDVSAGETHVLLGENGAGKSTLIKVIAGVVDKDRGTALFGGYHLDGLSPQRRRSEGLSVIYQELSLVPGLSVAANVFLGRDVARSGVAGWLGLRDLRRMNAACRKLFADLGIELDPQKLVRDLPIAERQLVEITRAVAFESKLILMDEPTTALGQREKAVLFRLMATLKARNIAIVFVSHILEDCLALGDRITVLRGGKRVKMFHRGGATEQALIAAMTGKASTIAVHRQPAISHGGHAIEVRGLCVPGQLHDISFDLREGEVLGFAGLVGAGRTELMNALYGAGPAPTAGTIRILGTSFDKLTPRRAIAAGVSFLTEDRKVLGILPQRSIADNMVVSALNRREAPLTKNLRKLRFVLSRAAIGRFAGDMIRDHGVRATSPRQLISHLSGGNQQKVLLVRALAAGSRIVILDEPTKGIDAGARQEIYAALQALVASGASVIVVSSEIPEVLALSDRIVVMAKGRISGILDRRDATPENILKLAFDRPAPAGAVS